MDAWRSRDNSEASGSELDDKMVALNTVIEQMADFGIQIDIDENSSTTVNIPAAIATALRGIALVYESIKDCEFLQVLIKSIPVVNTIFNVVSYLPKIAKVIEKILSTFWGGTGNSDVGIVVRSAIDDALERYDDEQINTKAEACIQSFQHTQQYLRGLQSSERITESDIHALQPRNMAENKDAFICELKIRIERLFKSYDCSADKDSNTARKILTYLQLYCQLIVVKQVILFYLVCIIQRASDQLDGTIAAISNCLRSYRNDAERLLAKLANPNEMTSVVLAILDPDEMPFLHKYMSELNIYQNLDYLKTRPITMATQRYPEYDAVRLLQSRGLPTFKRYVRGKKELKASNESHFVLEKAEDGNYFSIRLDHDTRSICMHVDSSVDHWLVGIDRIPGIERIPGIKDSHTLQLWGISGAPGKDCVFKIIRLPDGSHLISPRQYPRYFLAMSRQFHKYIHGVFNDQDQRSHWEFD
ncbi:toxin CaTX-A-like [Pecten maximus]|uniref:toxin CaTX-A-like n=1 Tax=Pecten maximus TaxID=6579 RepID=UPI001458CFBC|nr:toxin CaTX-A-like [Pecten maximus]